MGPAKGVEIAPHIRDLIPWLTNLDKRRIAICKGCGFHFIGHKIGQKCCSPMCRNLAWRKETGYEPNRNYQPKGKQKTSYEEVVKVYTEDNNYPEWDRNKAAEKQIKEILKAGNRTFRKPYGKLETVALDDPKAIAYLETLYPSEKGDDNAKI